MGINPVHFAGATAGSVFPIRNSCSDVWKRYSWQNVDSVSHYDLAVAIREAEDEIASELGWYPAPMWIAQEVIQFPRYYRPDMRRAGGRDVRDYRAGVKTDFAKIIAPGRRAVTLLETATVAGASLKYSDEDGDGFAETATVTVATTLTNADEIKVYITDTDGIQEWEIRSPRSKSISGGNYVAIFDSWLFIDPDVLAAYPTDDGISAVDISTTTNYVSSVDVYREYNDTTAVSAELIWEPQATAVGICTVCSGTGCEACSLVTQDGCMHVRDANIGIAVPTPATYDSTNLEWDQNAMSVCRDPDFVKLWYYAGDLSNRWRADRTFKELTTHWANAIAWMATARLERPFCNCGAVTALATELRRDLAFVGETSQQLSFTLAANPFGTRVGEIKAWQQVQRAKDKVVSMALV
jgi:hypothetical protein